MTISRSAIAALAAVALFISVGASAATREEAIAARNAAKSGEGARLGASLAVLQKAAARRVPQSDVTRRVTRKLPALRASQGYVSVSAYGDDLPALRAQLEAKGLVDAVAHPTAVSGRAPVAALERHGRHQRAQVPAAHARHGAQPVARRNRFAGRSLAARRSRAARSGATGKGIRVGVLSDSYDCATGAVRARRALHARRRGHRQRGPAA